MVCECWVNRYIGGVDRRSSLKIVTVAWIFGAVWFAVTTSPLLTTYARALGCGDFQFGLINALPFLAALLSLPASVVIDATGQRQAIFLTGLYIQRAIWLLIALVPLWLFPREASAEELKLVLPAIVTLFLLMYFLQQAGQAVGGPAWVGWMSELVPDRIRGRYFARRRQLGVPLAIAATLVVGWLLDRYAAHVQHGVELTPEQRYQVVFLCSMLFVVATIAGIVDIALFHWVPHTLRPRAREGDGLLHAIIKPVRNRRFVWFAGFVATMFFANGLMGQFVSLYVLERVGMGNLGAQMMMVVVPLAATALVLPVWGLAVDRVGKKPLLYLSALGAVPMTMGWVFVTSGTWWIGLIVATGIAVLWVGMEVTNFNYVLEMSAGDGEARQGGTGYVAINSVVTSVAAVLGGVAGGLLAKSLAEMSWTPIAGLKTFDRFDVLFVMSGLIRLVGVFVFLPRMVEPQAHGTLAAARFMVASIYATASELAKAPVRLLRVRD